MLLVVLLGRAMVTGCPRRSAAQEQTCCVEAGDEGTRYRGPGCGVARSNLVEDQSECRGRSDQGREEESAAMTITVSTLLHPDSGNVLVATEADAW